MIAEGLSYPNALALIDKLKEHNIEANITVGGVRVAPLPPQVNKAKKICKEAGAYVSEGKLTLLQQMTLDKVNAKRGDHETT